MFGAPPCFYVSQYILLVDYAIVPASVLMQLDGGGIQSARV